MTTIQDRTETLTSSRPEGPATAPTDRGPGPPDVAPGHDGPLARETIVDRCRDALRRAARVPATDPHGALAELDALVVVARDREPGVRAQALRDALCARFAVASSDPEVALACDAAADAMLDELLAVVAEQGLSLFGVDAQVLLAHRALIRGDDENALAAVSTALSHLDEQIVVDDACSAAEHRGNLQGSYRLVARSLASLGMHENGAVLLDRARTLAARAGDETGVAVARYESVRLGLSWGLRLERAGRDGGARLYAAGVTARAILAVGPRLPADHQPLLQAATVLGRRIRRDDEGHRGDGRWYRGLPGADEDTARRDAAAVERLADAGRTFPSFADRLITELAHARALERVGRTADAADLLAAVSARSTHGEPNLVLSVARELGRLRAQLASGCDTASRDAKDALSAYTAQLEAELWSMHQARELSLRSRLAHDRLRREHHQVSAQALADPLTGLPNRRALDEALATSLADVAAGPLSVAMIDVDGFKQVNDVMSHAHGDQMLRLVAGALRRSLRAGDLVARYGGDEFVVVLPGTSAADAAAALGRAVRAVAELSGAGTETADPTDPTGLGRPGVTLSVGVVAVEPPECASTVLGCADAAMYRVKHAGGNGVVVDGGPAGGGHDVGGQGAPGDGHGGAPARS